MLCDDFLKFLETDIFVAGSASAISASLESLVHCARRAERAEARPAAACTSEQLPRSGARVGVPHVSYVPR